MNDQTPRDALAEALDTNVEYREKAEEKARAKKDPMSRLDEIRERHAARLRTRAAKGDGAVQMSTLVDDDMAWLLDAYRHMVESWQTIEEMADDIGPLDHGAACASHWGKPCDCAWAQLRATLNTSSAEESP